VPDDSFSWALDRVQRGKAMLTALGIPPVAWNTPHYFASDVDYQAFKMEFDYCTDRGLYYTTITKAPPTRAMLTRKPGYRAGTDGQQFFMQQTIPYPLVDVYGISRIPETIGYVDPVGMGTQQPPALPAELVKRANSQLVVRDGWAGCYFHWYLDVNYLDQLLPGIQGLGYTFTPIPST
jgi:hypothetical protein